VRDEGDIKRGDEGGSSKPPTSGAAAGAMQPPPSPPVKTSTKRVEVLVENLGHRLLQKGDVTDDEQYVALLKTARGRKLVREVK
jgi:hypothetical protein